MGRDGPLLPPYFRTRTRFIIYASFLMKIQYTKFRWYVWMNLLMEILNILIIIHFEDTLIASVRSFKIDSPDFDSQKEFWQVLVSW